MHQFPDDFEDSTGHYYMVSPGFKYYIDYKRKINRFIIRDVQNQEVQYTIPKNLLYAASDDQVQERMNRFKWVNDSQFEIVN